MRCKPEVARYSDLIHKGLCENPQSVPERNIPRRCHKISPGKLDHSPTDETQKNRHRQGQAHPPKGGLWIAPQIPKRRRDLSGQRFNPPARGLSISKERIFLPNRQDVFQIRLGDPRDQNAPRSRIDAQVLFTVPPSIRGFFDLGKVYFIPFSGGDSKSDPLGLSGARYGLQAMSLTIALLWQPPFLGSATAIFASAFNSAFASSVKSSTVSLASSAKSFPFS